LGVSEECCRFERTDWQPYQKLQRAGVSRLGSQGAVGIPGGELKVGPLLSTSPFAARTR
jgi:hypothetical protein